MYSLADGETVRHPHINRVIVVAGVPGVASPHLSKAPATRDLV